MPKKPNKTTLKAIIDALPNPDVTNDDLKELVLQFIVETPSDDNNGHYASRAKVKLEALRLLSDIIRNQDIGSYEEEVLGILGNDEDG